MELQAPLPVFSAFRREIPSVLPARDSEVFSDHLWIHLHHGLCSSILKHVHLQFFPQYIRLNADDLLFIFPKVVLKLKSVVSPWPTDPSWLSAHAH